MMGLNNTLLKDFMRIGDHKRQFDEVFWQKIAIFCLKKGFYCDVLLCALLDSEILRCHPSHTWLYQATVIWSSLKPMSPRKSFFQSSMFLWSLFQPKCLLGNHSVSQSTSCQSINQSVN